MKRAFIAMLAICILGTTMRVAVGQPDDNRPRQVLKPPMAGAAAVETKERLEGRYSAVSKLNSTDTRDGIGVRYNLPVELANKKWGKADAVSLVAFSDEPVAFGKYRGIALRLFNRTKTPASFEACDSRLFLVQEARDDKGRWREIEDLPCSFCGNSYHQVLLAANEVWEFSAPVYKGAVKTKIRFRLDAGDRRRKDILIYSNEFDGEVAKTQFRMGPTAPEVRLAFRSKDPKEEGVVETLIALLDDNVEVANRRGSLIPERAAEHLAELGPDARDALPALRRAMNKKGTLGANAAFAIWRIGGKPEESVKALTEMLETKDHHSDIDAAWRIYHMGPAAKDAVPALCRTTESDNEYLREASVSALGAIRSRADLAVPTLMKILKPLLQEKDDRRRGRAAEALGEFAADGRPALSLLHQMLAQKDGYGRVEAAIAVWKIEKKTELAVPALIEALKSPPLHGILSAAEGLGEIGPAAKQAVPQLTRALEYGSGAIRIRAAGALWKITRKTEPSLAVLSKVFMEREDFSHRDVQYAVSILDEMGAPAKAAVPALRAALKRERLDDEVRELLEMALRKFDSECGK